MAKQSEAKQPERAPVAPTPRGPVKVRATRLGYYEHIRRRVGDVFTLVDERHFSATWMERVAPTTPEKVTTPQQDLRRQHDEILRDRTPAAGTPLVDDTLPTGSTQNPLDV